MTLTAREAAPDVPIAAVAHDDNAVDVLELSGATHVLPLKRWLGEQLASRVQAQQVGVQPLGEYGDLKIAEMPVRGTSLSGKTIRETKLRQETGVHIIGVWERGPLEPPSPDHKLTDASVPVVMGTQAQLRTLHDRFAPGEPEDNPVVVIGGGTVGQAAIRALDRQGIPVNLVELQPERCELLRDVCENVYQGDASNYAILQKAGISEASAVLLTTNEDAINVYLASYCRKPERRPSRRQSHHPLAQPRGHLPCRRRFCPQLLHAGCRRPDVDPSRQRPRGPRRGRRHL